MAPKALDIGGAARTFYCTEKRQLRNSDDIILHAFAVLSRPHVRHRPDVL